MPTTHYTQADMDEERGRRESLEHFLQTIGVERSPTGNGWQFDQHKTEAAVALRAQRDEAEKVLLALGWSKPHGGMWTPATGGDGNIDELRVRSLLRDQRDTQRGYRLRAEEALRRAGWTELENPAGWSPPSQGVADGLVTPQQRGEAFARAADRRESAEDTLRRAGWTESADGRRFRPPVGGLAPTLVAVLEKVAAADSDRCLGHQLSPGDVRAIAMGLDGLRASKPPRVLETVDWLNGEVLGVLRDVVRMMDAGRFYMDDAAGAAVRRAVAAVDQLVAAGDRVDTSEIPEAGPAWFAGAALSEPDSRRAFTVSRTPDPVAAPAANARMIALPVLDAIALLAVIDRYQGPFAGSTRAAEALGELEQATELWLDARAGGA